MSRLIDENDIIKMLNTMDRYTSEELTLCDTDKTFPMNEVFIVDDVFEGLDELPSAQPEREKGKWIKYEQEFRLEEIAKRAMRTIVGEPFIMSLDDVTAIYEAIDMLRSQPEQHWIPCSERMPEKEEQVLIYAWNVHYVLAKYREIRTCDGVYKMAWVTEDAYSAPREIKYEVICWMPLPEPYAERRTDGKDT